MKLFLLLAATSAAFAQQLTLSIPASGPIRAGNTVTVQASLVTAGASIAALQVSLRATTGGAFAAAAGPASVAAGKQTSCALVNGDFNCIIYGVNANAIADGVVASFDLQIPANATPGQAGIVASNTLAASPVGDAVTLAANSLNFTLASPISPCDPNGDGTINVQDVVLMVSQIVGLAPAATDLDGDGKTTVADLMRVIVAANGGACRVGR